MKYKIREMVEVLPDTTRWGIIDKYEEFEKTDMVPNFEELGWNAVHALRDTAFECHRYYSEKYRTMSSDDGK